MKSFSKEEENNIEKASACRIFISYNYFFAILPKNMTLLTTVPGAVSESLVPGLGCPELLMTKSLDHKTSVQNYLDTFANFNEF